MAPLARGEVLTRCHLSCVCVCAAQVMKAAKGATMDDIMECLVILADLKDFDAFNGEYKKAFPAPMAPPSRVAYEAKLIGTAAVEIKCIGDVSKYGPW